MERRVRGRYPEEFTGLEEPFIWRLQRYRELTRAARDAFTPLNAEVTGLPQSYISPDLEVVADWT